MISNKYYVDRVWTLDKNTWEFSFLPLLFPQMWPQQFSYLYTFPPETLHPGKVLLDSEGQKATEARKPDFGSVMLSEKDLNQKREMKKK